MLGYMEGGAIYNAINFDFCGGYDDGQNINATAWTTLIPAFLCPSDPNAGNPVVLARTGTPNTNSYRQRRHHEAPWGSAGGVAGPPVMGTVSPHRSPPLVAPRVLAAIDRHVRLLVSATGSRIAPTAAPTRSPSRSRSRPSAYSPSSGKRIKMA